MTGEKQNFPLLQKKERKKEHFQNVKRKAACSLYLLVPMHVCVHVRVRVRVLVRVCVYVCVCVCARLFLQAKNKERGESCYVYVQRLL
jgi:hypothetical protein